MEYGSAYGKEKLSVGVGSGSELVEADVDAMEAFRSRLFPMETEVPEMAMIIWRL